MRRGCSICHRPGHDARTCDPETRPRATVTTGRLEALTPATSSSCAVCARDVRSEPLRLAPIGRDGAEVRVCIGCDSVPAKGPRTIGRVLRRDRAARARAEEIREHRRRLNDRGLCAYGEAHGAVTPGSRFCPSCYERYVQKKRKRAA